MFCIDATLFLKAPRVLQGGRVYTKDILQEGCVYIKDKEISYSSNDTCRGPKAAGMSQPRILPMKTAVWRARPRPNSSSFQAFVFCIDATLFLKAQPANSADENSGPACTAATK